VERWRSDCGCVTGERPGFSLDWRAPLRQALDWLRSSLGARVDEALAALGVDVEDCILAYGDVIAGAVAPRDFALPRVGDDEGRVVRLLELLEMHRAMLYAFTSCAWFFADPGEIETSIVLRYAAVALENARAVLGLDLEPAFVERLADLRSAHYEVAGLDLWRRACDPYRLDPATLAAAAALEYGTCDGQARFVRGLWRFAFEDIEDGRVRVLVTNAATLRRWSFATRLVCDGRFQAHVEVEGEGAQVRVGLDKVGVDVLSRVAASWLVEPGSRDYEAALNMLVAELLVREATADDEAVLLALACGPRYVTPIAEASIRRALLAIRGFDGPSRVRARLVPLYAAVGLDVGVSTS
jgi:hypothetical protein